ncbi:MAG: bifunctional hydroxymethylpyrimidine kinase/phosphomethylpyrimidine kinase [Rhodospirillales bacterium]|nr:bifunctional hydroxymethylpyrimidine kinase/phosphomethylpyrimidine kinase [Rhodospirillales bacterium]
MTKQILCIGQSDSCAVAGVQADLKTIHALGGYAATVLTAVSAKNTQGYRDTMVLPEDIVSRQVEAVLDDLDISVIKTGMMASTGMINLVAPYIEKARTAGVKIVIDPVMNTRFDRVILNKEAKDALKRVMLIHADVLIPNVKEAEELTGMSIRDIDDMKHAAEMLTTLGPKAVILRGGDMISGDQVIVDVLVDDDGAEVCQSDRSATSEKDGVGATLSSAIAISLAQGMTLSESYVRARTFVNKGMAKAEPIGKGFGPLNHCVDDQ